MGKSPKSPIQGDIDRFLATVTVCEDRAGFLLVPAGALGRLLLAVARFGRSHSEHGGHGREPVEVLGDGALDQQAGAEHALLGLGVQPVT